eukprot:6183166-Pleurochrysis_carterae.AAC.1
MRTSWRALACVRVRAFEGLGLGQDASSQKSNERNKWKREVRAVRLAKHTVLVAGNSSQRTRKARTRESLVPHLLVHDCDDVVEVCPLGLR